MITLINFFKFIKNNYKTIFVLLFVLIFMLLLNQCNSTKKWKDKYKSEEQRGKQNLSSLSKAIEIYKNLDGKASYKKAIAQMSPKELEENFPDLYKKMKAEAGEVKYISSVKIEYRDTGSVKNQVVKLKENLYALESAFYNSDSSVYLKNKSTFSTAINFLNDSKTEFKLDIIPGVTEYQDMKFKLGFTTGIKKDKDGLYKVFVTPDNDKVAVGELKGADVSDYIKNQSDATKNKKRWGIGPNIGYGLILGKNNSFSSGILVGISIQYSAIKF